jgi:hypothetical protein
MSDWIVKRGVKTAGGLSESRLRKLIKEGKIQDHDLLSCDNGATWHTLSALRTLATEKEKTFSSNAEGKESENVASQAFRYQPSSWFSALVACVGLAGSIWMAQWAIDGSHQIEWHGFTLSPEVSRTGFAILAVGVLPAVLIALAHLIANARGVNRHVVVSRDGIRIPHILRPWHTTFFPWNSIHEYRLIPVNDAIGQVECRFYSKSLKLLCSVGNKMFTSQEHFEQFMAMAHAALQQKSG